MQSKCWKDWQTAHRKKEYYFQYARRQKSLLKHSKSNSPLTPTMPCPYNIKPEDRHCEFCSILCVEMPIEERIKKASATWKGVDIDAYMDMVRGREPEQSDPL